MSDNRIIKFRIWCHDNKKFITDTYEVFCPEINEVFKVFQESKRTVIQQFIGLNDKNGKPIYEGDLVNFTIPGITHGPEREDLTSQEVHWAQEEGSWAFGWWESVAYPGEFGYYTLGGDRIDAKTLEIVGNIFENPELVTTV